MALVRGKRTATRFSSDEVPHIRIPHAVMGTTYLCLSPLLHGLDSGAAGMGEHGSSASSWAPQPCTTFMSIVPAIPHETWQIPGATRCERGHHSRIQALCQSLLPYLTVRADSGGPQFAEWAPQLHLKIGEPRPTIALKLSKSVRNGLPLRRERRPKNSEPSEQNIA